MGSGAVVDFDIKVSEHARARAKLRLPFPRRAVARMARIAYERGISREAATGALAHYLDGKYHNNPRGQLFRVHADNLFVFGSDGTFVTVWRLPRYLRGACC